MLDLEKKLKPKELNEFKETVIEWGVDYGLHNSLDSLDEFIEDLKFAFFEEGDTLNNMDLDRETVLFWVEKLKPEMIKHNKNLKKQAKEKERTEKLNRQLKEKFIKLRAEGKSIKEITDALNLSLEDIKSWLEKDPEFYTSLNYESQLVLEDLQSKYASKAKRIEFIVNALNSITEIINKRGFEDVPTGKLLDYAIKFMTLLNTEKTEVNLSVTKEEGRNDILNDILKTTTNYTL